MSEDQKHKTVGVSFPPELRQRASERARGLGLSFSKYVTLCVEAEVSGKPPQLVMENLLPAGAPPLNLEAALEEGSDYGAMKAASIGFEDDIEEILRQEDICYSRFAQVAHLRTDFLVQHVDPATGRNLRIALECKYNVRKRATVTLGQCIILKSLPGVDAVMLCVPYLKHFDPHLSDTFAQQGIPIVTPDSLNPGLESLLASLAPA
ncbi:hypothetical protein H5P28_08090 [Ruficoccus amylovorans]|uniref:Restriction endonuclease n=1 Tax=Ruficoccus amylovorans TaxID=1804625 RepID=A0A842HG42_9BACT|nr:hypothetical protein [Ruficoccus amylovorans]MBC2594221.1 hypothetical protein [Ruficoccus amylovorans]